jgi:hypothetical protein
MKIVLLICLAVLISACGPSTANLKKRAAFDFDCSEDQIKVVEIDNMTRGAIGCNNKGVYITNCSNPLAPSSNCTWLLDKNEKM